MTKTLSIRAHTRRAPRKPAIFYEKLDGLRVDVALSQWERDFPALCREEFSPLDHAGIVGEQADRIRSAG